MVYFGARRERFCSDFAALSRMQSVFSVATRRTSTADRFTQERAAPVR
jgi:hypothetical protein